MRNVGGKQSVFFVATFTMRATNGTSVKARSRNYAIPEGNVFYQVSFIDHSSDKAEDCSDFFELLESTIRIASR
jgi:hypothetical protein